MPGPCTPIYAAAAEIAAPIMNGQIECPQDMAGLFEVASCKLGQETTDRARKKIDEKILCGLFCCCLDTGGNQGCVEEALTSADAQAGHQARYKAEVSYNMQFQPPRPMMKKDDAGNLTTEPIPRGNYGHLANRAEIEYDQRNPQLRRLAGVGGYRFRRPDVVVVKDPSQPPSKTNISQVIEMKFPGDRLPPKQKADYERIGGESKFEVYRKNKPCRCEARKKRPGPTASDWTLLVGLGLVTVGAALLPVDGPAGEAAAGAAAVAQWARMFSPAL